MRYESFMGNICTLVVPRGTITGVTKIPKQSPHAQGHRGPQMGHSLILHKQVQYCRIIHITNSSIKKNTTEKIILFTETPQHTC